jgi:hypothetical protein
MDIKKLDKRLREMQAIIDELMEGTSPFTHTGQQLLKLEGLIQTIESEQGSDE